jgi:hypothetical protein
MATMRAITASGISLGVGTPVAPWPTGLVVPGLDVVDTAGLVRMATLYALVTLLLAVSLRSAMFVVVFRPNAGGCARASG